MGISAGTRFGRYEIGMLLGSGGMGEVYRATDTSLGRPVAIKVLPASFSEDHNRLRRFEQEAKAAGSLNHPNIFTIYDIGTHDHAPYVVSELLEGETLRQRISRAPIPPRKALDYGWQVANGMAAAHEKGILHRDLKPENIFITASGVVKILDFGLAKPILGEGKITDPEASTELAFNTDPGTMVGTVYYMSPEQLRGGRIDRRSDIFSFGLVFHEILTGRHPVPSGTPFAIAAAILSEEEIQVDALSSLSAGVKEVIKRALMKNPENRFASFKELKGSLKSLKKEIAGTGRKGRGRLRSSSPDTGQGSNQTVSLTSTAESLDEKGNRLPQASILVLPLETLGPSGEDSHIGVGLAHAITTDLAKINGLSVLSKVSVSVDAVRSGGGRQLAAELGATIVLEGEVMREGATIRVMARLIDVESGRVVWGGRYREDTSNLFSIHDAVCDGVASALRVNLSGKLHFTHGQKPLSVDIDAFEFYSNGRAFLERHYVKENLDFAIKMFEEALSIDNGLALAYAGLSETYWRKYEVTHDKAWVARAISAGDQALILDPLQGQVHVSLGILYYGTGKIKQAIEEFKQAIDLQPMNAEAHSWLGRCYIQTGGMESAVGCFQQAIEIRPGYWDSYNNLGICYHNFGRYDDAAEQFRRVIAIQPDNFHGYNNLGGLYCLLGKYEEAMRMHKRAVEIHPAASVFSNLGTDCYYLREYELAVDAYEKAKELDPEDDILRRNLGDAYLRLGKEADAKEEFESARKLLVNSLAVTPEDAQLLGRLAICQAKLQSNDQAVADVERALAIEPKNTTLMYQGAVVYALSGHFRKAIGCLDRALDSGYSRSEVESDPDLEKLRITPEYATLLSKEVR